MRHFFQAFERNPDGSWTCQAHVTLYGPQGRIQIVPGNTFSAGTLVMGVDVAQLLEQTVTGWERDAAP
jgi:hypothetical protein